MTEDTQDAPTDAAAPDPPKKRFAFKRAAWQTAAKNEGGKSKDMFSHSNEYSDILAEQVKRKKEAKTKIEEEKRKKAEEEREKERERKRRKVSTEDPPSSAERKRSSRQSKSPFSPLAGEKKNGSFERWDSLTKPASSAGSNKKLDYVDLGDSDSDVEVAAEEAGDTLYKGPSTRGIPKLPSKPAPVEVEVEDELEEVEDPRLAALAAQARARAAAKKTNGPATSGGTTVVSDKRDTAVQLFIESEIPDTKPLLVKIKSSSTLEAPRKAWCGKQGLTPAVTDSVFLTWKGKRLWDSTKVERCGIRVDTNGWVTVEGSSDLYDETNLPKIYLQAWTETIFKASKAREAEEAAAKKKRVEEPEPVVEEEPEPEPEPQKRKIRLFLKAKGKEDYKIQVNSDTTFEHLTSAYKQYRKIPADEPITLMFDGDRLRPMDTVADADIDDMDAIEVHFK